MLLWLETVRWFSIGSTQEIWYLKATKNFWRAGYQLFHGKFISFGPGPRGVGKCVSKTSPSYKMSPEITQINFAVPSRTTLFDQIYAPMPTVLQPGVIDQTFYEVQSSRLSNNNIYIICVDGKKVTAGLDEDFGDVNVFGFEDKPRIQEKREDFKKNSCYRKM